MLGLVVVGGYRGFDKKRAFPIESENALEGNGGEGEKRRVTFYQSFLDLSKLFVEEEKLELVLCFSDETNSVQLPSL